MIMKTFSGQLLQSPQDNAHAERKICRGLLGMLCWLAPASNRDEIAGQFFCTETLFEMIGTLIPGAVSKLADKRQYQIEVD